MNVIQKISRYFFISLMLVSEIVLAYPVESVKWHPGHYYAINYGKNDTTTFLPLLYDELKKRAGFGGPDTFVNEPELNDGVYSYYPKLSGIVPLTPSVQPDNYRRSCKSIDCPPPSVDELLTFARDSLKANYLYWTRDRDYYQYVLNLLNKPIQRDAPLGAGGLRTACPSSYISCLK